MMTVTYTRRTASAVCPYHSMDSMFGWTAVGRASVVARAEEHNERLHPRSVYTLENGQ